jgi:transcriptional regulator with XRE-family HTH domain
MSFGSTLKEALKHTETEQLELALEMNYSRQTVSAWANDSRNIQEDALPKVAEKLDYPNLYLESALLATGGVSIPVLDGDYIDQHPASMKFLVQKETNEALDELGRASFIKPISYQTSQEKEEMKKVIRELLDAACSIVNMVAILCREYNFSMKDIYKSWFITLKARRMRK